MLVAISSAFAQDPIVEYGPAPNYSIIGLHHLAVNNPKCQMQRYSGAVVAVEGNPYLITTTSEGEAVPWQTSFTLSLKRRRILFPLPQLKGVSGDQLAALLNKGRVLRVHALRCGPETRVDSIEIP